MKLITMRSRANGDILIFPIDGADDLLIYYTTNHRPG